MISTSVGGDLRPKPVVVRHPAGRRELADLVADRGAHAGDAWRLARPVGGHEVDRAAADGVGRPVVGDGLEPELALDLEHVADVMEDPGQVAVRQAPVVAVLVDFFLVVERNRNSGSSSTPISSSRRGTTGW